MNHYGVVYHLINKINGNGYIGQAVDFKDRMNKYKGLRCKQQPKLYNAIKKYGWNNFDVHILEVARDKEDLNILECFYMDKFQTIEFGYNLKEGGSHGKYSDESKSRMKASHPDMSGENNPMYGKFGENNPNWGRKDSLEGIANKKKAAKSGKDNVNWGKKASPETRAKHSLARSGEKHPNWGKETPDEVRAKIATKLKGVAAGDKNPMYNKGKVVICLDDGEIFATGTRVIDKYGGTKSDLCKHLKGKKKTFKSHTFSYYTEL